MEHNLTRIKESASFLILYNVLIRDEQLQNGCIVNPIIEEESCAVSSTPIRAGCDDSHRTEHKLF